MNKLPIKITWAQNKLSPLQSKKSFPQTNMKINLNIFLLLLIESIFDFQFSLLSDFKRFILETIKGV